MRLRQARWRASEVERRFQFTLNRSQVRTWALANGLARQIPQRVEIHTRRWQRQRIGELFQLDATPDFFLGHTQPKLTLLNMLDDCSRLQLGCRLYLREDTMAYLDFFERTLFEYGLPFEVYVDNATFFRSTSSEAVTLLGQRLRLYGVSFRYASSPQSKGKVERVHQIWQVRIPAFLEYEGITLANTPLSEINDYVRTLLDHRNCHEIHREIGKTPQMPGIWLSKKGVPAFVPSRETAGGPSYGANGALPKSPKSPHMAVFITMPFTT